MAALRVVVLVSMALTVFRASADVWLADGYEVEFYGHAPVLPGAIDFDNAGALFIGNEEGDDSFDVPIFKIQPGGGDGAPFGDPLPDPDAVVVDRDGAFNGTPGAVLVGGNNFHIGKGYVAYILPDGTNTFVWEFLVAPDNPGRMTFDTNDRLLIAGGPAFGTYRSPNSDELPSFLVEQFEDGPQTVATDANDRLYTSTSEGTVSFYSSTGEVIDLEFSTNLGFIRDLVVGPGADWGCDLYAGNSDGELYRIDASGNPTLIGSGFNHIASITFGPGNALYIAERDNGESEILRLTITPSCPWDVNGDGVVDHHDVVEVAHNLGPCDDPDNCPWDINCDGVVNGADVSAVATHIGPCP